VNQTDQTVSVVDITNNTVIATVPFPGIDILYLAVNPVTNRIYMTTGYPASTVYVLDGTNNSVITTIPIGNIGVGIAVDPNRNVVYAANHGDNTISVIDGNTNSVVDTIAMPGSPFSIAVDQAAQNLFVTASDTNFESTLYVVSEATDTVIQTILLPGTYPLAAGVAVDAAVRRAYVIDNFAGTLDVIDADSFIVLGTVPGVDSAVCLAVNPFSHNVLVGNATVADGRNVASINPATLQIVGRTYSPKQVIGVTVDPTSGHKFVTVQPDGLAVFQ
jgi:YVTN family beta-propeller protein